MINWAWRGLPDRLSDPTLQAANYLSSSSSRASIKYVVYSTSTQVVNGIRLLLILTSGPTPSTVDKSRPRMYLLDLPEELLTQILGDDNEDVNRLNHQDYFNLSLVSKRLHSLVTPLLHRFLDIKLGAYAYDEPSKTEAFACERLLKGPGLGSYVRKLKN